MVCPKCKSENVTTQIVSEQVIRKHHKGLFYYFFVAWWLWFAKLLWNICTIPFRFLGHTTKHTLTEHKTMCVCQNCGKTWQI